MLILRDRNYSEYQPGVTGFDRTDNIKRMKDSDIIAEKKRSNAKSYKSVAKHTAVGAGVGATIGAGTAAVMGFKKGGLRGAMKHVKLGAGAGAAIGGTLAGGARAAATHNEREQNRFVNRRLGEAKRQAYRRENRDWKTNNTSGREGYTY
jgi:hypothetical protein